MLRRLLVPLLALAALAASGAATAAGKTQLTWYGHAAFKIVTPRGHVLLVDPWITNPANPRGKEDLATLTRADLILISHGHFDHIGDAVEIAKRTGAKFVGNYDLGNALVAYVGFPAKLVDFPTVGNVGGTVTLLDGEVSISFEEAVHGATLTPPAPEGQVPEVKAAEAGGFVIRIKDGPTFYHTGDTAAFGDMKLIGDADHVNVMLACIGDHFTMGPQGAALAVQMVHPDTVIPMHYATFPVLTGTAEDFAAALKARHLKTRLQVMKPGETAEF